MQKIYACLLVGVLGFVPFAPRAVAQESGQKISCVITGYYSPLPNQNKYVTGSYAGDKRLNGNGTNGADGTEVYPGMIAAPKSIAFGTKVEIPGYGVGTVHDRGGAIITYTRDDTDETVFRFDLWMGKGDEGLARALQVGLRSTTCTLYANPRGVTESIVLKPVSIQKTLHAQPELFADDVNLGMKSENVKKLQGYLKELGYFSGPVSGYFGDVTLQAVINYQINKGIILNKNSFGAGNVGPKTQQRMTKDMEKGGTTNEVVATEEQLDESILIIASGMGKDASGEDVRRLQSILSSLNFYHGEINGIYDWKTIEAVYKFQKEHNVIGGENDFGAGYFGKKTLFALNQIIKDRSQKILKKPVSRSAVLLTEFKMPVFKKMLFVLKPIEFPIARSGFTYTLLVKGLQNEDVRNIQSALHKLGYLEVSPTGYYGDKTVEAVWQFQYDQELLGYREHNAAGKMGPKTRRKLAKVAGMRL